MNTNDHPISDDGGAPTIRAHDAPTEKTRLETIRLLILGASIVPGVVIGAANIAVMMLRGLIVFTVILGFSPYWGLLTLRGRHSAPDAPVSGSPAKGIPRALTGGLLAAALLGPWGPISSAQAGPGDCPHATVSDGFNGASRSGDRRPPYTYPFRDPYVATITSAMLNADGLTPGLKRQVVHVPVLPGRNDLPGLEGRGEVSVALYRQANAAPLLFILSGIGSSPYFGLATYYAGSFHREGFHVVILPSPMNWNFALAASRSGRPGYAPADARDLYDLMQKTLDILRERHGVAITGVDFMGVSLGALQGAYLSVIDADQGRVGIGRYLLVNPPLDLSYALKTLDQWAALQGQFGKQRSDMLRAKALAIVESAAADAQDDPSAIGRLADQFSRFTTEELKFLIGQYVHTILPELIYVTQAIHDQHVLAAEKGQMRRRLQEAKAFTLADYSEKIAVPSWARGAGGVPADSESANRTGSLMAILDRLRHNPRVHIMHNVDDVLADRGSIAELKGMMGDRMIVYPAGGHLGNLWYCPNRDTILALFRRFPEPGASGG